MGSRRARRANGRVQKRIGTSSRHGTVAVAKPARKAAARTVRKAAIALAARGARAAAQSAAPVLLALVPASDASVACLESVKEALCAVEVRGVRGVEFLCVERNGVGRDFMVGCLDAGKVADGVVIVFDGKEDGMDEETLDVVAALRSQGLPSVFSVAVGDGADDGDVRKRRGRELAAESLGEDSALRPIRVVCGMADDGEEVNRTAMRRILSKAPKGIVWRSRYGYMRVAAAASEAEGRLVIEGWTRGRGFSANELCHITGIGAFRVKEIVDVESGKVLSKCMATEAEPVESAAVPDGLMGEQTWPPEVDADLDDGEDRDMGSVDMQDEDSVAHGVLGEDREEEDESVAEDEGELEDEGDDMDEHDMAVDEDEVARMRAAARTDAMFPDEVDTPINQPARVRYARYRGLKSLRTGEWDPKEQLPRDYATLFQFRNLPSTRKRVLAAAKRDAESAAKEPESANFALPGAMVRMRLVGVPVDVAAQIVEVVNEGRMPVIASGMLRHENRRSVVHFGLQRVDDEESGGDVKAKAELEIHCGFVRFIGRPMLSEHNANSDKHKMERYFVHGRYTVASFYGPAVYAPAPAMLFRPGGALIATGSALGADPDRIILKRIILTGYPFKTQKRKTVAKFMFFSPEDIRWFKPVELWSKMGRSGHILEPMGTHGHMKCIFDSVIMHHDTICMTLYKRVYPKLLRGEGLEEQGNS